MKANSQKWRRLIELEMQRKRLEKSLKINKEDIIKKREQIKKKSIEVAELDIKVESIKSELEALQVQQIDHYYRVLQLGMDTRQEGLSWIIKSLWILGENVKI